MKLLEKLRGASSTRTAKSKARVDPTKRIGKMRSRWDIWSETEARAWEEANKDKNGENPEPTGEIPLIRGMYPRAK